ncbi:MAG: hypothetical protein JSS75_04090 [Bacteroidetes bacterium]|nr:hypothetical protein [Bacteroidota bacterium]
MIYICVYTVANDRLLAQLCGFYSMKTGQSIQWQSYRDHLIDVSEDPSFLAHELHSGSSLPLTWGICRPNVRNKIAELMTLGQRCTVIFIAREAGKPVDTYHLKAICDVQNLENQFTIVGGAGSVFSGYGNLLITASGNGSFQHQEYFDQIARHGSTGLRIDGHGDWYERVGAFDWHHPSLVTHLENSNRKEFRKGFERYGLHGNAVLELAHAQANWGYVPKDNYVVFDTQSIVLRNGITIASVLTGEHERWERHDVATQVQALVQHSRSHLRVTKRGSRGGFPHPHVRMEESSREMVSRLIEAVGSSGLECIGNSRELNP